MLVCVKYILNVDSCFDSLSSGVNLQRRMQFRGHFGLLSALRGAINGRSVAGCGFACIAYLNGKAAIGVFVLDC